MRFAQFAMEEALERIAILEEKLQKQQVALYGFSQNASSATDTVWFLTCAALVFVMQAGFALVEQGSCRLQSMQSILMKNITDSYLGAVTWFVVGYGVAFGLGVDLPWLVSLEAIRSTDVTNFHFQSTFCFACTTIVSGGVAERMPMGGYAIFSVMMCGWIYPIVVSQTWGGGFLAELGFVDLAGSGSSGLNRNV